MPETVYTSLTVINSPALDYGLAEVGEHLGLVMLKITTEGRAKTISMTPHRTDDLIVMLAEARRIAAGPSPADTAVVLDRLREKLSHDPDEEPF